MESPLWPPAVMDGAEKMNPACGQRDKCLFSRIYTGRISGERYMTGNIGKLIKCVCYNE